MKKAQSIEKLNNAVIVHNPDYSISGMNEVLSIILGQFSTTDQLYVGHSLRMDAIDKVSSFLSCLQKNFRSVTYWKNYEPSTLPFMNFISKKFGIEKSIYISEFNEGALLFQFFKSGQILEISQRNEKLSNDKNGVATVLDENVIDEYIESIKWSTNFSTLNKVKMDVTVSNPFDWLVTKKILDSSESNVFLNFKKNSKKKNAKSENIYHGASLNKVIGLMRKHKSNVGVHLDNKGVILGVAVKHKKRYKYLKQSDIGALLLNYHLGKLSREGQIENGSIMVSSLTFSLLEKIASKYNVETIVLNEELSNLIRNSKYEKVLFATNEFGEVFFKNSEYTSNILVMEKIVEMVEYYFETKQKDLFSILEEFNAEFGVHRYKLNFNALPEAKANRLFSRIHNIKLIGRIEVEKVVDSRIHANIPEPITKIYTKSLNQVGLRIHNNQTLIAVESIGDKSQQLLDIISFERDVNDMVTDNIETFETKRFSWKTVFKYAIFLLIMFGMLAFIFNIIYSESKTETIWSQTWKIFNETERWIWISMWSTHIFNIIVGSWKRYRMMQFQNATVQMKHLIAANVMGSIVSFLTPFTIGGDAIVYWYLRRKGAERGPLIASLMTATLMYQITIVVQTMLLFPIGFKVYIEIFQSMHNVAGYAILTMFIVGLIWNVFASVMILLLIIWKGMQEFIIEKSTLLLEWLPMIHVYDPMEKAARTQYGFREMRIGSRKLWANWKFVLEILGYSLLTFFIRPYTFIWSYATPYINDGLPMGKYIAQLVASDILNTANSLSLTPGGSGTGEWLGITITDYLTNVSSLQDVVPGITNKQAISSFDLISKIVSAWPYLIISAYVAIASIFGESQLERINELNKNSKLQNLGKVYKTHYFTYVYSMLIALIVSACVVYFVI